MSKKKLNTKDMMTELSGSSFFSPPRPQAEKGKSPETTRGEVSQRPPESKEKIKPTISTIQEPKTEPMVSKTPPTPQKRVRMRYSFEAFNDQAEKLQSMKAEAEVHNDYFSISRFIRDALDEKFNK